MRIRSVDLAVLSDIHLGTRHCRAEALLAYLEQLDPRRLVLNGDIIDFWHMGRRWPAAHVAVAQRLLRFAKEGVEVHLLTGNHDDVLRRFVPHVLGHIRLDDHLELDLDGRRTLFVHGDLADGSHSTSAAVRWVGGQAYDGIMALDSLVNRARTWLGYDRVSLLAQVKERLPIAASHIARYEAACAAYALARGCTAVVCGHIHLPRMREIMVGEVSVQYLNSGDWVEHCTALEYHGGWSVHHPAASRVRAPVFGLEEAMQP